MAAAAPGEGDPAALRAQVRFLEDNVRRLNEALSAQQLAAGDTPCASAGQTFLEGVQEGDPLPLSATRRHFKPGRNARAV